MDTEKLSPRLVSIFNSLCKSQHVQHLDTHLSDLYLLNARNKIDEILNEHHFFSQNNFKVQAI